jgi:HEAT repeat protein
MKRSSAILVTAALAAVTAVVAIRVGGWWDDSTSPKQNSATVPSTADQSTAVACAFEPGERAAFSLQVSGQAQAAPDQQDLFKAVLSWEVVDSPHPGEWLLRAGFSSTELRQSLSRPDQRVTQPLDGTFMIRVGRDCRFTAKGYPPDWEPITRRFVATVLGTFEFAVDPTGPSLHWDIEQADALGTYAARYNAVALSDGALQMTKVKTRYLGNERANSLLDFKVQLVDATAEARLDRGGRWLRSVNGHEQVRISVQGSVLADLAQRYELTRDDARFNKPDQGVQMAALDWQDPFAMAATAAADEPVDPAIAKLAVDAALNRFSEIYFKTPGGDAYAAGLFLAQWLKAHPEQAAHLVALIREGGIPERLRPATFMALQLCGTPQARAALMTALADESMTEMDRARAAFALSDVPHPTQEAADALVKAASDSQPQVVSGTSVRALGHLTERARTLDPEMQQELQRTLSRELATASDDSRTIDVVDAIGNSGDTHFLPALEERLADGSPAMREHAARALRRMAPPEAMAPLLTRLEVETDPSVQIAIVDTLAELRVREPDAIALANQQLVAQPTPEVRAALIRWLGAAAADQPGARAALIAQFRRERVPQLQQLIGQYVSADELS